MTDILGRIVELACPGCKGQLEESEKLYCKKCDLSYEIKDGIAHMVCGDMVDFAKEIAVQDKVAIEYEQKRYQVGYAQKYHDWWTDQMLKRVNVSGRILDNGCGIGLLYEKIKSGNVVGLDLSSEMLRHARKFSDQLVLGNSQQLPFKDKSFDLVFCRSLLHHLPNPGLAVKEISRVLKPGGELVLVDTNTSILSSLPRKIANKGDHFSEEHQNLSRKKLEGLLRPNFEIDDVVYFGYVAYPLLGFPDLVSVFKYVPFKSFFASILMGIDKVLGCLPLIRSQSWAILIKATVKL